MCGVGATGRPLSLSLFSAHFPLISAFSTRLSSISFGRRGHLRRSLAHKACQPYHVISPWGRAEEEGLGAGEVAAEPAMIPDGEKLDANRHATNGGSRRGTAWSSNGAGESRMRMREIPGIHGGDDDERRWRWRRTRDFQADTRRALTQPAEATSSAAPV